MSHLPENDDTATPTLDGVVDSLQLEANQQFLASLTRLSQGKLTVLQQPCDVEASTFQVARPIQASCDLSMDASEKVTRLMHHRMTLEHVAAGTDDPILPDHHCAHADSEMASSRHLPRLSQM